MNYKQENKVEVKVILKSAPPSGWAPSDKQSDEQRPSSRVLLKRAKRCQINLGRRCMRCKDFKLNARICQAQMDAAKACRHGLDVVVQALMKERLQSDDRRIRSAPRAASSVLCLPHSPVMQNDYLRLTRKHPWPTGEVGLSFAGAHTQSCFSTRVWNSVIQNGGLWCWTVVTP